MLGDNAVYLAKEINKLDIYSGTRDDIISTLIENKLLITSFYYAVSDMGQMMFHFQAGNDRGHNMYGFQGRFDAISSIANILYLCANGENNYLDPYPKDFARIAYDLEDMAKVLDYEIYHNMKVIDNSRDTEYSSMKSYSC